MRHTDWCRIRISPTSDPAAASALIPQARAQLGQLMQGLQLGGIRTGVLRRQVAGGATIAVAFDGTTPTIDIDVPAEEGGENTAELYNLWLPRGFVVQMATDASPGGVGLPVVLDDAEDNPEALINLAPGLALDRWTDGGGLGDVLLSKDAEAGFPRRSAEIAPLLYHRTLGPHLLGGDATTLEQRPDTGEWHAFRLELAGWDTFHTDESAGAKRALWQAINAHRADLGLPAMVLWPRGYYRPGQLMANVMQANGDHGGDSSAYPVTYRSVGERLTKDGYPLDTAGSDDVSSRATAAGTAELRHVGGTAEAVLAAWLDDDASRAAIEADSPHTLLLDVGYRAGFWSAAIVERDHWVAAGNCQWSPGDGRMPPLSWHGFRSLNFAFETLPVGFTGHSDDPLALARPFVGSDGECWMRYYRTPSTSTPALGRHVYHRGRAIAVAPPGALVWAAGVIDLDTADRLVILAHHQADQPSGDLSGGVTRYLRVWWCDIPRRDIPLRADRAICGTVAADPFAWRGGEKIDVGIMPQAPERPSGDGPNALKYTSAWRFSPDGRRVVCLRDYGPLSDYSTFSDATTTTVAYGLYPRALELVFEVAATGDLLVSPQWQPLTPGWVTDGRVGGDATAPLLGALPVDTTVHEGPAWPVAIDYTPDGALHYAFVGTCLLVARDVVTVVYLGTGPASTTYVSDLAFPSLISADIALHEADFRYTGFYQVLDVNDAAFVVDGTRARLTMDYTTGAGDLNSAYQPCRLFSAANVHGVRTYRAGVLLDESWYPCPDGVVFQVMDLCDTTTTGTPTNYVIAPAHAVSQHVQACYARRDGEWLFSTALVPQPLAAVTMPDSFIPTPSHCDCQTSIQDYGAYSQLVAPAQVHARGGRYHASFDIPAGFGGDTWLSDAKAV